MPKNTTKNRIIRTVVQLVAAGGATAFTTEVVHLVPSRYAAVALAGYALAVTAAHNLAEDLGWLADRRR